MAISLNLAGILVGMNVCIAMAGLGCGSPSGHQTDAGPRSDHGTDDAFVGDGDAGEIGVDAGPYNALGPCDTDDNCDPTYTCSFAPNGVRICIAVGTAEDGQYCGLPEARPEDRHCLRGSHCDYLPGVASGHLQCRRYCDEYGDCEPDELCLDGAFPGPGGLCIPSGCDFDGVLSGAPLGSDAFFECSCIPWEMAGEANRARDQCAQGSTAEFGEDCHTLGERGEWCNTWTSVGEAADTSASGIGGVCVPGADHFTCRQVCRTTADCLDLNETCTDIMPQLTATQVDDLNLQSWLDFPLEQVRVCLP